MTGAWASLSAVVELELGRGNEDVKIRYVVIGKGW
jgi:hypothetical protein